MSRLIKALIVILSLALLLSACSTPESAPEVGKRAPEFRLASLDGKERALTDFRGRVVVLNFWATWCPPCREEMPTLQHVYHQMHEVGVVIVGVNLGDPPSKVKEFVEETGVEFPILLDTHGKVAQEYRVRALPLTFWIDSSGVIRDITIGGPMPEEFIMENLDKLLKRRSAR